MCKVKNKNIYFVGYFLGIENKMKYVDLFTCKNKYFLESDIKESELSDQNNQYFPEILYRIKGQYKYLFKNGNMPVTSLVKQLYKRDIRHFKALNVDWRQIAKIKKLLLLLLFSIAKFNKKNKGLFKLNIFKVVIEFYDSISLYRKKDSRFFSELETFMFKVNFTIGYKYSNDLLNKIVQSNQDDIYILWGKSYSSRLLLLCHLKKNKIPYFVSEYGEVPGTISCSKYGIFGESFSTESWLDFSEKDVQKDDIRYAEHILNYVKENQLSTRSYGDNMYFLMKYFYDNSIKKKQGDRQKIIYVNGSELFSSGLYHNRWNIDSKGKNPNKMLLNHVVSTFNTNDYMIIYKEHPMAMQQSPNELLRKMDFPTVNFIHDMNIHDILELADIIITYPSKVVMTSLLYEKTTFVLGDFTIPHSIPSIKYFTSTDFTDINEIGIEIDNIDNMEFVKFVARLIKYSLIIYDEDLYYKYDRKAEQKKLNDIITDLSVQNSYY